MIYRQPVRSEYRDLAMPVLIAVGAQDRTVVMKSYGDPARTAGMGDFPAWRAPPAPRSGTAPSP